MASHTPRNSGSWQEECNFTIFEEVARHRPTYLAVASRRGILTYDDLNIQANQLAHHLRSISLGPENVVAVSLERGIEYIIAMFAICTYWSGRYFLTASCCCRDDLLTWLIGKAGAAYLPLDVAMPHDRMMFMVSEANASCLITTADVARKKALQHDIMPTIYLDDTLLLQHLRGNPAANQQRRASRDNLAYVFYTSGTSGKPKGVCISHGSIVNMADDTRQSQEITASDRVLLFSPFCFDASTRDIHGALLLGASLYVPEEDEILPGNLVDTLRQHSITYAVITPSVLRACKPDDLPALSTIVVAGEAASRDLIRKWGTGRILINAYGPTEATVFSTKRIYHDGWVPPKMPVTTGTPILNTHIHILDDKWNPVPVGTVGEIYVHGPGVSQRGYLNLPGLNAECFRDDLFDAPGRTYRTGDSVRMLLGGEVEFLGRKNKAAQIKLYGQRIKSEEIENVLRTHGAVHDALLAQRGTESHNILAAYVVPAVPSQLRVGLVDQLEALLSERLPSYSVPSFICLIDTIPVRITKKIDLDVLPDPTRRDTLSQVTPANNTALSQTQSLVSRVLFKVLGLPEDTLVTQDTTSAELGGTSLLASLVVHQLNETFGCRLRLGQIYRRKISIRNLADLVDVKGKETSAFTPDSLQDKVILPHDIRPSAHQQTTITATLKCS